MTGQYACVSIIKAHMKRINLRRFLLLVIILTGIGFAITLRTQFNTAALAGWIKGVGSAAPVIFIAIYAFGTVLFLPGSVLTLTGGALFGPVLGTLYNLIGATLGATLAFLTTRYLASDWVERTTRGRLKQIIDGVDSEGWRFVAFVRLVPIFPFNLLNYALGLTRIRLSHYIIASFFCMAPGAVAYTYLGYAGREALGGKEGMINKLLIALGLLVLVIFIPRFIRRLRTSMISTTELKQRLDNGDDVVVLDVRSAEEFSGELGHIHGALNISVDELQKHMGELEAYRNRQIACVCHTDKRSARIANMLKEAGFSSATVVRGGMVQWNRHHLPVEK